MTQEILNNYLKNHPEDYDAFKNFIERADLLFRAKVFDDAKELYNQAYIINPTSPDILFRLGTFHYHQKEDKLAVHFLTRGAQADPDNTQILNNLGAAYGRLGNINAAIKTFMTVCKKDPSQAPAAFNCGRLLLMYGHPEEAERWLVQADKVRPNHGETLRLLTDARLALGQAYFAMNSGKLAVKNSPENIDARRSLAQAYFESRKLELAFRELKALLSMEEKDIKGIYLLAKTEEKRGNAKEAKELYESLFRLGITQDFKTLLELKHTLVLPVIPESKDQILQARRNILAKIDKIKPTPIEDPFASGGFTNFLLAYQGLNDIEIQRKIADFYIKCCPELEKESEQMKNLGKESKWKIGIVSSFLRDHTVGYLTSGLIKNLDRKKFEVILFRAPTIPVEDQFAPKIANMADKVIDLPNNLNKSRKMIADEKTHILYYPEIGMEDLVYFLSFSRSAPLQIMGWGHPITSGVPNIDVFLSVENMETYEAQEHYSEKLIKLKELSICVKKPALPSKSPDGKVFGIDPEKKAYLCAQSLFKIHPDFDSIIHELLQKDSNGIIYFITIYSKSDEYFLNRLEKKIGENIQRVKIIDRVYSSNFTALLKCADVLLDIPQWSGGKTTLESLAVGTPVVHLPGEFMRGRHTLAFYKKIEVLDCIAETPSEYVDIAFKLANNNSFRNTVRNKILESADNLFENKKSIDEISQVFESLILDKLNL